MEAEGLLRGENASDSVTTVSALFIFTIASTLHGKDAIAQDALMSGRQMGERLGLFGVPHSHHAAEAYRSMSPETIRMASHTAWGGHNWLT